MGNSTNAVHTWLKATCGDDSYREIARRAGLSDSIISRQIRDLGALTFEVAAGIARAYDSPVLGALLANGLINLAEAGADTIEASLNSASDEQLVLEIARRLDIATGSTIFDRPIGEATERAHNVTHLHERRNVPGSDQDSQEVAFESDLPHEQDTDDLYDA